jgi:hypothetical protein
VLKPPPIPEPLQLTTLFLVLASFAVQRGVLARSAFKPPSWKAMNCLIDSDSTSAHHHLTQILNHWCLSPHLSSVKVSSQTHTPTHRNINTAHSNLERVRGTRMCSRFSSLLFCNLPESFLLMPATRVAPTTRREQIHSKLVRVESEPQLDGCR